MTVLSCLNKQSLPLKRGHLDDGHSCFCIIVKAYHIMLLNWHSPPQKFIYTDFKVYVMIYSPAV